MLDFLKFSLISSLITTAAAIVMFYFARNDFSYKDIYNEGVSLYRKKQYRNAIGKFKLAVSKYPNQYHAHYNLGLCELALKNYKSAKAAFLSASNINKLDVDVIYNLAYTEMLLKNYQDAQNYFNKILGTYPDEADVLFNLGYISFANGELEEAKTYVQNAIQNSPNNNDYKLFYLELLEKITADSIDINDTQEVLSLLLELLVDMPTNENLLYKAALLYAKMGEWENSVNYCEKLAKINPNSFKAYNQYGLALFCKGDNIAAIEMYEKAIKIAPQVADPYINLIFAYDKAKQTADAIQLAEVFIEKFPNSEMLQVVKDFIEKKEEEEA